MEPVEDGHEHGIFAEVAALEAARDAHGMGQDGAEEAIEVNSIGVEEVVVNTESEDGTTAADVDVRSAAHAASASTREAADDKGRRAHRGWSEAEDFLLAHAMRTHRTADGIAWGRVMSELPWRRGDECSSRSEYMHSEAAAYMTTEDEGEGSARMRESAAQAFAAAEHAVHVAVSLGHKANASSPETKHMLREQLTRLQKACSAHDACASNGADGTACGSVARLEEGEDAPAPPFACMQASSVSTTSTASTVSAAADSTHSPDALTGSAGESQHAATHAPARVTVTPQAPSAPNTGRAPSSLPATVPVKAAARPAPSELPPQLPPGYVLLDQAEEDVVDQGDGEGSVADRGLVKLRCPRQHVFYALPAVIQHHIKRWQGCPLCVISAICNGVGQHYGASCDECCVCADGEHIRDNLLGTQKKNSSMQPSDRVPQHIFEQAHSRPSPPVLPLEPHDDGFISTASGVLRVKWRCECAGHTWYTYEKLTRSVATGFGGPCGVESRTARHYSMRGLTIRPVRQHAAFYLRL